MFGVRPNRVCYLPSRWRQGPRKQDSWDKELAEMAATTTMTTSTTIISLYNDRCRVRDLTLATQCPPIYPHPTPNYIPTGYLSIPT